MQAFANEAWEVLRSDFADMTDIGHLLHILLRLSAAVILGGVIGYQREKVGKAAGMRTHMLVTAGSAFFVMVPELAGMGLSDSSRVLQGIITGIGFLGGGVILKLNEDKEIKGLTTAAGIWFASGVGVAVGYGKLTSALIAALMALAVLELVYLVGRLRGWKNEDSA